MTVAKEPKRCRRRPVLQGWLLEILETVEMGGNPIAGLGHFPSDLGVTPFVGPNQLAIFNIAKPDYGKNDEQTQQIEPG